jgi:hypothetical protein
LGIVFKMTRKKVFISYARNDAQWLKKLELHLKPLEQEKLIELVSDTRIETGANWRQEIAGALATFDMAILLISADYLASEFISDEELPSILTEAEARGTRVIPIFVKPCLPTKGIESIQALNSPRKPVSATSEVEQETFFVRVAEKVRGFATSMNSPEPPAPPPPHVHPPRWRGYLLPGIVGLFLGLVLGFASAWYWWRGDEPEAEMVKPADIQTPPRQQGEGGTEAVYIIGGGTAHLYLNKSGFINLVKDEKKIELRILEGPTDTGAKLFGHAYDQATMLVMASKKLDIKALQRSDETPQAVFEAYLGADIIQLLLAGGSKKEDGTVVLHSDFSDIVAQSPRGEPIKFSTLASLPRWSSGYVIYAGDTEGGTRKLWESYLCPPKEACRWPSKVEPWDIRTAQVTKLGLSPRMYLGSKVLNQDASASLGSAIPNLSLTMLEESGEPAARGLYLYGWVNTRQHEERIDGVWCYTLPTPVADTLRYVYMSLSNSKLLDEKCIGRQIKYFNLKSNSKKSGVDMRTERGGIYRPEPCEGQPKK